MKKTLVEATVVHVGPAQRGTDGRTYRLVAFKLAQGGRATSYICPHMKNFHYWKGKLDVGTVLKNLELFPDGKTIDADSRPIKVPALKQDSLF